MRRMLLTSLVTCRAPPGQPHFSDQARLQPCGRDSGFGSDDATVSQTSHGTRVMTMSGASSRGRHRAIA